MVKNKSRILVILLALVILGIALLTFQNTDANTELSEKVRLGLVKMVEYFGGDAQRAWWNTPSAIRRLAHTAEYFALGIMSYLVFDRIWLASVLCVAISFLDQAVRTLLPIRHFDTGDLAFDALGYITAIFIAGFVGSLVEDYKYKKGIKK